MGVFFYLKNLHFYLDWNCLVHTRTSHGKFYFKVIRNFASEQTPWFKDCNVLRHLNRRQNLKWECHAITNNYTNESTLYMYQSFSVFLPMHIQNTLIFISTDDLTCTAFANANLHCLRLIVSQCLSKTFPNKRHTEFCMWNMLVMTVMVQRLKA